MSIESLVWSYGQRETNFKNNNNNKIIIIIHQSDAFTGMLNVNTSELSLTFHGSHRSEPGGVRTGSNLKRDQFPWFDPIPVGVVFYGTNINREILFTVLQITPVCSQNEAEMTANVCIPL